MNWPRAPFYWREGDTEYASVPFTWTLPDVQDHINQRRFDSPRRYVVGGPAVRLMPNYLTGCEIGGDMPGVLQRVNPQATRTTLGCPNRCQFCAIGKGRIEGEWSVLEDWPDNPILCDNNLLAAPTEHIERVVDRLVVHGWADFNQGLDCRLMTPELATLLREIPKPIIRLSLDSAGLEPIWTGAVDMLRSAGIQKAAIQSYVLVGFNTGPEESWARCSYAEKRVGRINPQWYHSLDCMEANTVTDDQRTLGWTDKERARLMGWFYRRRGEPLKGSAKEGSHEN